MKKLDKTFKLNPLYEADGYKIGHKRMLAENTTKLYGTWIPRSLKYMHPSITKIMSAGQQLVVRYIHSHFKELFFDQPIEVAQKFSRDMTKYLSLPYDGTHFEDLHKLGYLPFKVKALPEGIYTNPNIPHATFINTVDGYAWLTLYLETMFSKLAWQLPTVATIGAKFKKNAVEWVTKTDPNNLWLTDYMCHDFHSRGGNPFTSIAAGIGHALSNTGSDTLNVIEAARYYYDVPEEEVCINSVNASEHSVSTTKIFTVGEKQMLLDWLKEFQTGILSWVIDTFSTWDAIKLAGECKEEIMSRDGKLTFRPDSGNPVDIICGTQLASYRNGIGWKHRTDWTNEEKGVVELLWDMFGGTVNDQGYKVLDTHVSVIYGDSINLERQIQIYERLEAKGFASTNILVGVGSFSYQYMTRDQAGYAAKGAWFENNGKGIDIYKEPVTDDGTKKSLKGLLQVAYDPNGELQVFQQCTKEQEEKGELKTIYEDGKFYNQITLSEIRERLKNTK